jgi:hypothetical protein
MASNEEHSKGSILPIHNPSEPNIASPPAPLSILRRVYSWIGRLPFWVKATAYPGLVEGKTTNEKLYAFARGSCDPDACYLFKRFETLSLFNIYHYQHELVQLNQKVASYEKGCSESDGGQSDNTKDERGEDIKNVRNLLREYCKCYFQYGYLVVNIANITQDEAIRNFKEISQMKRPNMKRRNKVVKILSKNLNCEFYETADDALTMLDLTPEALNVSPDKLRVAIQHLIPNQYRRAWENFREDEEPSLRSLSPSQQRRQRPSQLFIYPTTDIVARLIISILGGAFLMVPMISLAYSGSLLLRQLLAVVFLFLFAVCVAIGSNASNQELLMASAGYSAVLVVFIGRV